MDPALSGALVGALELHIKRKDVAACSGPLETQRSINQLLSPRTEPAAEPRQAGPGRVVLQLPLLPNEQARHQSADEVLKHYKSCPVSPAVLDSSRRSLLSRSSTTCDDGSDSDETAGKPKDLFPSTNQLIKRLQARFSTPSRDASAQNSQIGDSSHDHVSQRNSSGGKNLGSGGSTNLHRLPKASRSFCSTSMPASPRVSDVDEFTRQQQPKVASISSSNLLGSNSLQSKPSQPPEADGSNRRHRPPAASKSCGNLSIAFAQQTSQLQETAQQKKPRPFAARQSFCCYGITEGSLSGIMVPPSSLFSDSQSEVTSQHPTPFKSSNTSMGSSRKVGFNLGDKMPSSKAISTAGSDASSSDDDNGLKGSHFDDLAEGFKALQASQKSSDPSSDVELTPRRRFYFNKSGKESGTYIIMKNEKVKAATDSSFAM